MAAREEMVVAIGVAGEDVGEGRGMGTGERRREERQERTLSGFRCGFAVQIKRPWSCRRMYFPGASAL